MAPGLAIEINIMNMLRLMTCLIVAAILSGCAGLMSRGDQADGRYCVKVAKQFSCTKNRVPTVEQQAKAKQFAPEPGKHIVWLVRRAKYDSQRDLPITVGGTRIETLPHTLSRVVVEPGIHKVDLRTRREMEEVVVNAQAGEQTFVELAAHIGLLRTTVSLRRIPEAEGRKLALVGRLINDIRAE